MAILDWIKHHSRLVGGAATMAVLAGGIISYLVFPHGMSLAGSWRQPHHTNPTSLADNNAAATSVAKTKTDSTDKAKRVKPTKQPAPVVTPPVAQPTGSRLIGLYVDEAPGDPAAMTTLDWAHAAGFNAVYNYSSIDGSSAEITRYLDHAQSQNIQVIFSLKDLYDQLPGGARIARSYPEFGSTNEAIALNVVKRFAGHSATWGFAITDEAPEQASGLPKWLPILTDRYRKIKAITGKPVMDVLVADTGDQPDRRAFLSALRPTTDTFALDYYPVPYEPIDRISEFAADLPAVGMTNGWAILQNFSWASYPETATGLGYNLGVARAPTTAEMVSMGKQALAHGAQNLLFYSYFDIKNDPLQRAALQSAITQLKE